MITLIVYYEEEQIEEFVHVFLKEGHNKILAQQILDIIMVKDSELEWRGDDDNLIIASDRKILVDYMGYLIEKKKLNSKDVKIVLYAENGNKITSIFYDDEGYLDGGWPFGFFFHQYDIL